MGMDTPAGDAARPPTSAEVLAAQVDELRALLHDAHAQLAERDEAFVAWRTEIEAKWAQRLADACAQRDAQLAQLTAALAGRDARAAELERALADRDARLAALQAALSSREAELVAATARLGQAQAAVADQAARLQQMDTALTEQAQRIRELHAALADYEARLHLDAASAPPAPPPAVPVIPTRIATGVPGVAIPRPPQPRAMPLVSSLASEVSKQLYSRLRRCLGHVLAPWRRAR
ncbi:MAG: hypothetical protein IRZ14_12380 [Chloroflexi bacterium]|nr:hypothetical protein [Chloroflexota bacterium]